MTEKNAVDPYLRLSAQRAFLGRVHEVMRLIKIIRFNQEIYLEVICETNPPQIVINDVSEAAAEILADFSDASIQEKIVVHAEHIPPEDVLKHGWVFRRAEAPV